jgi:catechol 2,3-dioxygenase-like lactoylglutathione lyase family enzyme
MPSGGLAAIGLRTADRDRSVRFYTHVLGGQLLRTRDDPDRRAWLRVFEVPIEMAEVAQWTPLDENQRRFMPAVSFLVEPADLDDLVSRLEMAGVPRRGPVLKMAGESVGVYFSDPDGNPLSFSCPQGYPGDGLSRNAALFVGAPFDWAG